ncbi:DUF5329 domain-containing protein [Pseudomonas sp. TH05]|uniref:DUF5329 domain-containing protein n=1 Tax=unclassified Pseudomonas TaxID=196821 RepID=UPI0019130F4F|nr:MULTISPECIES: DUF5329 domain-containing protein [unclassified Pseudomonas]MBK5541458.1 DUF5329 domain-containing protein [Pseudomonas sp. TH07]MBK5558263.1 DUF5329 domain-containing protein [Pseudomonas sp. TH05]
MEIMKRGLIQWLTAVGVGAVLTVSNLQAQTTPQATQEINGLLSFVERSDCLFVRNGTEYPAPQARQHLEKKLSYLENKNMVSSAEDFINLAASKSSISGKAYEVRCPSGTQPASTWLQTELQRLRQPR